jgi:hypothetical protein
MNDNFEEEDLFKEHRTLIGQGDDWPEYYDHGFDAPMQVVSEILLDSEACDLSISWLDVLSGWRNAREAAKFRMGFATRSISNPNTFAHERI